MRTIMKKRLLLLLLLVMVTAACGENTPPLSTTPSGRLIVDTAQNQIISLDVATQTQTVLFERPQLSWIYEIDASAAAGQIAIAYTQPPELNKAPKYDRSGIYLLALDGSQTEPQQLIGGDRENEWYVNPIWSADGETLFYVRQTIDMQADSSYETNVWLERITVATGETQLLAADAVWPRLSNDDKKLTWIIYDADLDQFGLSVANADGTNQKTLLDIGEMTSISTPMFSPDDKWIYFTAAAEQTSTTQVGTRLTVSLLNRLMGVRTAEAHAKHDVEGHWWRIPADGGTPQQITQTMHNIVYGDFSPVSTHLAYTTANGGLYLADQNGENEQILSETVIYRTFAWLP